MTRTEEGGMQPTSSRNFRIKGYLTMVFFSEDGDPIAGRVLQSAAIEPIKK